MQSVLKDFYHMYGKTVEDRVTVLLLYIRKFVCLLLFLIPYSRPWTVALPIGLLWRKLCHFCRRLRDCWGGMPGGFLAGRDEMPECPSYRIQK